MTDFLYIGDQISLQDSSESFLYSQGFADAVVSAENGVNLDSGRHDCAQESVFLVRAQQNYTVMKELRRKLDAHNMDMREAKSAPFPGFLKLLSDREKEIKDNLAARTTLTLTRALARVPLRARS